MQNAERKLHEVALMNNFWISRQIVTLSLVFAKQKPANKLTTSRHFDCHAARNR